MLIGWSPVITVKGKKYNLHRAAHTEKEAEKICKEMNDEIKADQTVYIDHVIVRKVPLKMRKAVMPGANWGIFAAYTPKDQIKNGKRIPENKRS